MEFKVNLPEEFEKKVREHPELNLSSVIEKALLGVLDRFDLVGFIDSKLDKSNFTKEDADRLGELAKQNRLKELKSKNLL
ncbi:MAG: hypothetical protein WDZ62_01820 [Candidatus Pacearchaeota archaeon]